MDFNSFSNCSILGKRKYGNAFQSDSYDTSRYGNHIGNDYFKNGGVGHGVKITSSIHYKERRKNYSYNADEIYQWCLKYFEKKGF